ncbi:MAG TPA: hypothetical protein VGR02_22250, partial [Thermoanaerobaculia bacterium]|nr:hypothetical protein [Thermoanaerobaculia bacterium]
MRPYATVLTIAVLLLSMGLSAQAQSCPTPVIIQTGGSNPSCAGLPVTLDAGPGVTYLWSNGATTRYITDTPTATASYTVTVTDADGCSATSSALTVTVNPVNAATAQTVMPSVCAGANGQAYIMSPPSGVTWTAYAWSIANGVINGSSTGQTVDFTAGPNGIVTLTAAVTDQNGCETTAMTAVSVYETTPPAIQAPPAVCAGVRSSAQISYPPYYQSYSWSISGGTMEPAGVDGGPNTNRVFFTSDGPGPVTLTVTVTDQHGCPVTNYVTVPVRSVAPPVIHLDRTTMCPGTINLAFLDPPAQGSWQNVSWTIQNGTMSNGGYPPSQPQTSAAFNSDPTGLPATLTVTATDNFGCSNTASVTVPVRTVAPPVIHLDRTTMCPGTINLAFLD